MAQLEPAVYMQLCELRINEAVIFERSYIAQLSRGNFEAASYARQQAFRAFDEAVEMECTARCAV